MSGQGASRPRNPTPTVDIIIDCPGPTGRRGIVLIERRNPPLGWALPGGFIDYGESAEEAARREALEETGLTVRDLLQFKVYSSPDRDPRQHTLSVVFIGRAEGEPRGGDDAARAIVVPPDEIDLPLCFDHREIVDDYLFWRREKVRPGVC